MGLAQSSLFIDLGALVVGDDFHSVVSDATSWRAANQYGTVIPQAYAHDVDNRSTSMTARVTDERSDTRLVEVDVRGLTGSPLLGRRVRLAFNTKLTFVGGDTYAKGSPMLDLWAETTVAKESGAPPRSLGRLRLSEPAFVVPVRGQASSWTRYLDLRLELDHRQFDDIEDLRAGGGLTVGLTFDGTMHLQGMIVRLNPDNHTLTYDVAQSDWIRLLDQVQYGRYVSVEVAIPKPDSLRDDLAVAAKSLNDAAEALRRGAYEEAVADCREAFDVLVRSAGGKPQTKFGELSLTKDDRLVYVQQALLNVTHLAHHPNDQAALGGVGSTVRWDRADAQAIIAMLAALIRRAGSYGISI